MMSKLIIALCMVNLALSGYTSGWGDSQKRLASLSEERWSVPGSAQANARVLLGKGGGGKGDKGGKDKDKGNKDKDKGDKDKGGKDKGGKDKGWGKGGKKSDDKKKRKKKGCDDDNTGEPFWSTEWETTDESLEPTAEPTAEPTINEQFRDTTTSTTTTAIPTTDPTTEPSTDPTTSPSTEPSQEPTSAPTDDPTKGPTEEPTPAPTDEPTQEPTTPAPITEATVSAPPTVMPTCPNPEQVERDDYPCECYDLLDCDPSRCFEDQERCVTNPQLVAVLEEQADLSSAQAVAVQENAAASEVWTLISFLYDFALYLYMSTKNNVKWISVVLM